MSEGKKTALCNRCGVWTNQMIITDEQTYWTEVLDTKNRFSISGSDRYILLKCLGCDTVSLIHEKCFEDSEPEINRYPPSFARRKPDWLRNKTRIKTTIIDLLSEIYIALENESLRLCAIGIRALLEDVMIDCVAEQGSIGKNIAAFIAQGYVAHKYSADFRDRVIEAGHAAMHRNHTPTRRDIATLLDITEGLVQSIYVDPPNMRSMSPVHPRK